MPHKSVGSPAARQDRLARAAALLGVRPTPLPLPFDERLVAERLAEIAAQLQGPVSRAA